MEPLDYNQLLAQLLADPDAFQKEFGAAFAPIHDEGDALRQQMAMAQQRSQPLNRIHSTGQGGMFGALGDVLSGVGGGLKQRQLSERLAANQQRVGEQKSAQAVGLERLRGIQQGAGRQREASIARERLVAEQAERQQRAQALEAQASAAATKAADDKTKAGNELAEGLRKEFMSNPVTKSMQEVAVAYDKIRRAASKPSAAGDISLLIGYMKMLDPGSTVREGEFATAQNATGVPGQIINLYNRALSGHRLGTDQRADFMGQAEGLYAAHRDRFKPVADQFTGLATRLGVSPDDVVLDLGFRPPTKAGKSAGSALTDEDRQAVDWAKKNRSNPLAREILERNGVQ